MVIQIITAVFVSLGIGLILADIYRIPKQSVSKAVTNLGKKQK